MTTQIKPEELRCWNWVEFNGQYRQIIKIDAENELKELGYVGSVSLKQSIRHPLAASPWCAQLNPIQLTEDILIKAGFKRIGKSKDFCKKGVVIHTRKRGFVIKKSIPIVASVHQLQNLFFALTGEELNIQL